MGRLFDSPVMLLIILLVVLLLFGAPKLPGMARSLGQSMRIFKSEVKEMKKDDEPAGRTTVVEGETRDPADPRPADPRPAADPRPPRDTDERPGSSPA
ncbi:Sec-independent protein translocase subunit TatA [Kocuria sp. LUK]|uniref:Sec-independent protein translocase protein TatA n=1 Tax=Kocuria flava TaxID=446860 RepID=A0A2N4T3E0_9MICC|nr:MULTISPECIES: Sec-independent protein translocase subunit TatA [Kocuria]MCD1143816.1 Sec-independent protein translocase subunit TatA [Kocuria sp. LUK]PLC12737.1 preprotein translocase [Kocuria flava]